MWRRPLALFFVFGVLVACLTVASAESACGPSKTCFGNQSNALSLNADGGVGTDPRSDSCTTCLQTECCDILGACNDTEGCDEEFQAMQRCMIDRGSAKESECKTLLKSEQSKALYKCMRKPCGTGCGVPSCDLDPAVTRFGNGYCDRCIGSACCEQINACYGNRQCKLFLECITDHCPKTIGSSMTRISALPGEAIDLFQAAVCGDAGAVAALSNVNFDPGACLNRCLDEFARPDGGVPEENLAATCVAVGVYTCGAKNNCGPDCTATVDQPNGAYPEDSIDAGTH